jgi:hypothetical protein
MKNLLIAGALAIAFSFPVAACETVEDVAAMAERGGGTIDVIEGDLLEQFAGAVGATIPDGATRAIFVSGPGGAAFGFEMPNGCLTDPTFVAEKGPRA